MTDCELQLRVGGMGTPFAVDFGAVVAMGNARGVDVALLTEILPAIEPVIIQRWCGEGGFDE